MDSDLNTVLTTILTASWPRIQAVQEAVSLTQRAELPLDALAPLCGPLTAQSRRLTVANFSLSANAERPALLGKFFLKITRPQWEWAQQLKTIAWNDPTWKQQAHDLFLQAERLHIHGVVSYALVKASMVLRGIHVPEHLSVQVVCAKKTRDAQRFEEKESRKLT